MAAADVAKLPRDAGATLIELTAPDGTNIFLSVSAITQSEMLTHIAIRPVLTPSLPFLVIDKASGKPRSRFNRSWRL
jgi:hypothetical protein